MPSISLSDSDVLVICAGILKKKKRTQTSESEMLIKEQKQHKSNATYCMLSAQCNLSWEILLPQRIEPQT